MDDLLDWLTWPANLLLKLGALLSQVGLLVQMCLVLVSFR
jgi:hypothetical protein